MELLPWILSLLQCAYVAFASGCTFPVEWQGEWYQSGPGEIQINATAMSHKGTCVEHDGHKYLIYKRISKCYMCLVFTPQHTNLLQYKESFCFQGNSLSAVCREITGEFELHTMVRVPSIPVPCPFQGPYIFSYNNDTDDCTKPWSEIHACADESRFKFHFKHCVGMARTNELRLDFECLSVWNNGDKYLYGKFTGPAMTDKEHMYRCFMHDFWGTEGEMSMSADASCQGPQSVRMGPMTMKLTKSREVNKWPRPGCRFPEFFANVRSWRDLSGRYLVDIEENMEILRIKDNLRAMDAFSYADGKSEVRLVVRCVKKDEKASGNRETVFLTYTTNDTCVSKFQCVKLKKRSNDVAELYIGAPHENQHDACENIQFNKVVRLFLIPANSRPSPCPMAGSYAYSDKTSECVGNLIMGCRAGNEVVIEASCPSRHKTVEILQCLQNWTEGHMVHLIAQKPNGAQVLGYCLTYVDGLDEMDVYSDTDCAAHVLQVMNKTVNFRLIKPAAECKTLTTQSDKQAEEQRDEIIAVSNEETGIINGCGSRTPPCLTQLLLIVVAASIFLLQAR